LAERICETCKHFKAEPRPNQFNVRFGVCRNHSSNITIADCELPAASLGLTPGMDAMIPENSWCENWAAVPPTIYDILRDFRRKLAL
jgi:hypothetical protein